MSTVPERMNRWARLLLFVAALAGFCAGCDASKTDWEHALQQGTPADYLTFLQTHPESEYASLAFGRLVEALRHPDGAVAAAAVAALAHLATDASIDALVQAAVRDCDAQARGRLAEPVLAITDARFLDSVIAETGLTPAGDCVRDAAVELLTMKGDLRALPAVILMLTEGKSLDADSVALAAVARLGARATSDLLAAFANSEGLARLRLVQAIEATRDTAAVMPLIDALEDPVPLTVGAVAQALGTIGDPRALDPLLERFSRRPVHVISEPVAIALGRLGGQRALALFEDLDRPAGPDRYGALGLGQFGEAARERLERILMSPPESRHDFPHKWRRGNACVALGLIGNPASVPLLIHVVEEHSEASEYAAEGLGRIAGPRAVSALVGALGERVELGPGLYSQFLQFKAAKALANIDRSHVIPPLLEALSHGPPRQRTMAAYALGEATDSSAVEPLIRALQEDEPQLRIYAARA